MITVAFTLSGRCFIAKRTVGRANLLPRPSRSRSIVQIRQRSTPLLARSVQGCRSDSARPGQRSLWPLLATSPRLLRQLLADPGRAKAKRVMQAMVKVTKIDVAAREGVPAMGLLLDVIFEGGHQGGW